MKILIILLLALPLSAFAQKPTPKLVYDYCLELGISNPEIVTAQSILETGWYKCTYCSMETNNIFGFTYKGSYAKFDTWKESVIYYKTWQVKYHKLDRDYYEFLACMYPNGKGGCVRYAKNPEAYNHDVRSIVRTIMSQLEPEHE